MCAWQCFDLAVAIKKLVKFHFVLLLRLRVFVLYFRPSSSSSWLCVVFQFAVRFSSYIHYYAICVRASTGIIARSMMCAELLTFVKLSFATSTSSSSSLSMSTAKAIDDGEPKRTHDEAVKRRKWNWMGNGQRAMGMNGMAIRIFRLVRTNERKGHIFIAHYDHDFCLNTVERVYLVFSFLLLLLQFFLLRHLPLGRCCVYVQSHLFWQKRESKSEKEK